MRTTQTIGAELEKVIGKKNELTALSVDLLAESKQLETRYLNDEVTPADLQAHQGKIDATAASVRSFEQREANLREELQAAKAGDARAAALASMKTLAVECQQEHDQYHSIRVGLENAIAAAAEKLFGHKQAFTRSKREFTDLLREMLADSSEAEIFRDLVALGVSPDTIKLASKDHIRTVKSDWSQNVALIEGTFENRHNRQAAKQRSSGASV